MGFSYKWYTFLYILINLVRMWHLCSLTFLSYFTTSNNFPLLFIILFIKTTTLLIHLMDVSSWMISMVSLPFPHLVFPYHPIDHDQNSMQKSHFYPILALLKYLPLKTTPTYGHRIYPELQSFLSTQISHT